MSLWNKILLVLIGLASLAFFYTAARTLKTYQYWGDKVAELTRSLEAQKEKNFHLVNNDQEGDKGIRRLEADLQRLLTDRGRIWEKCEPQKVAVNGDVTVGTELSGSPNRISDKTVLYVFEDSEGQSGAYLGEFKASDPTDNKVVLTPTMTPTLRELNRLKASKGPWTLYELMPADRHYAFAGLSDEDKKALFPASVPPDVVAEYLRDGQPAKPDDPKDCQVDGKYVRRLQDYKEIFRSQYMDRTLFNDVCEALDRDIAYMSDAKDDAHRQVQFAQQYQAVLTTDKAVAEKERQAAGLHRTWLEKQLAGMQAEVARLIKDNLLKAAEIAKLQLYAARQIDARTQTMAQSGAGNR
jgi:hypothetical protein